MAEATPLAAEATPLVAKAILLVAEATPLVEGRRGLERNRSHMGQDTGVPVTIFPDRACFLRFTEPPQNMPPAGDANYLPM